MSWVLIIYFNLYIYTIFIPVIIYFPFIYLFDIEYILYQAFSSA